MSAEVVIELSGEEVARVPLSAASMVIGRDPSADIHLDNLALSRRHAQLEQRGAAVWIRDLGSQNGTYVNGERVDGERVLQDGDSVELGRYTISIANEFESPSASPVVTIQGPTGEQRFAMVGDEIIIGRSPSCDIPIRHKSISRQHLRITMEGTLFVAEDLGSQNGTRLRGQLIHGPTPFEPGEPLQLSDFVVDVAFEDEGGSGPNRDGLGGETQMIDRAELLNGARANGSNVPAPQRPQAPQSAPMPPRAPMPQRAPMDHDIDEDLDQHTANVRHHHNDNASGIRPAAPEPGRTNGRDFGMDSAGAPVPGPSASLRPAPNGRPPATGRPPVAHRTPQAPQPAGKAKVDAPPVVLVVHPDFEETPFELTEEVSLFGEDGQQKDGTAGRTFADQGYLLLIRTGSELVATVAGDRRLLSVNGRPQLYCHVDEGDTIELGLLAVIVQSI